MSEIRTIRRIITGTRTQDGAGVKLVRVFGYHDTKDFDPFLMLDAFDSTLFVYIIEGAARFAAEGGELITEKHAVLFNNGKKFMAKAADKGVRFLLLEGKPVKEPIAWGGPIVMNTKEELELAFKEIDENKFIK
ncbi:MAG: hypothetical protein A2008_07175 [Candidatus Wallbacteria bacterium GWC2_49_35]|uniref:Pirin C-terminal domain-containing protein n=1 Tax=Candidatus Wallbacteria bacterium GWC2_49_35 TaxID=1817813 RepID=A0A1F7X218_9BACT|nr:MAG: hypothetical protein A2008_07175 [Candidatus Wallbacteria bacterium GWC2_49_35]HBC75513.1 hypothetical protein [Candidatus Wallbacteria bacterium]